jgi:hypothetical protein
VALRPNGPSVVYIGWLNANQTKTIMKTYLLIAAVILSGCVAYPAYYPVPAGAPPQGQAQAAANEQCAKSGKVAVMSEPTSCDAQNCTTKWVCR